MLIAIDIGGTNLKSAVVDENANILVQNSEFTKNDKDEFIRQLNNIIFNYLELYPDIFDVGIGVPGILDENYNLIVSPNLTNLIGINIKDEITKQYNLNVYLENDANVAAIGEMMNGTAIKMNSYIYITLGTGVGGAIIYNRKLFRGLNGGAGEIGHVKICCSPQGNENFATNTLESLVGKQAIINRFIFKQDHKYNSLEKKIDVDRINELALNGNKSAIETLKETAYYLGLGVAGTVNLLDIPNVILGGGISNFSEIFYNFLNEVTSKHLLPNLQEKVQIIQSYHKNNSGIIGAAMLSKYFKENEL